MAYSRRHLATSAPSLAYKYKMSALTNCPDDNQKIFCAMVIDLLFSDDDADTLLAMKLLDESFVASSTNKTLGIIDAYVYYVTSGSNIRKETYSTAVKYLNSITIEDKDWSQEITADRLLELISHSPYIKQCEDIINICLEVDTSCPYLKNILFCLHTLIAKNSSSAHKVGLYKSIKRLQINENVTLWPLDLKQILDDILDINKCEDVTDTTAQNKTIKVAIALSGGGIRAAIYHAGVLCKLTENISNDNRISIIRVYGVSGGAIIGSFYCLGGLPIDFVNRIRGLSKSIFKKLSLLKYALPFSSPNKLANFIDREIFKKAYTFDDLLPEPSLAIQTFDRFNGEKLVFSKYALTQHKQYRVAEAVAASCSIPPFINPMKIEKMVIANYLGEYSTNKVEDNPIVVNGEERTLHDGGLIENSGIETALKEVNNFDILISSDCGALLYKELKYSFISYFKRFLDVSLDSREKVLKEKCRHILENRFLEMNADASARNIPTFCLPSVKEIDMLYAHGREKSDSVWPDILRLLKH